MDEIIYLDNAATTFPKPDVVHDTVRDFYREKGVNPGRTGCDLAIEAGQMIDGTRKMYSIASPDVKKIVERIRSIARQQTSK